MPLVKRTAPPPTESEPEPSLESLLRDLTCADIHGRRVAARGLGAHPDAAEQLGAALAHESDESVREAIFTALIRIGTFAAAAGLFPLLAGEDVSLRNGAIEALKTMPAAITAQIEELLAGPPDVRIFAVEILGALAHPGSAARLTRVLEEETHLNVCAAAVDALVECGDASAAAALRALVERFPDEPYLDFSVRTALARIANA
jgi:HEAT repeat protein